MPREWAEGWSGMRWLGESGSDGGNRDTLGDYPRVGGAHPAGTAETETGVYTVPCHELGKIEPRTYKYLHDCDELARLLAMLM